MMSFLILGCVLILLSGCATYEYHATKTVDAQKIDQTQFDQIDEQTLLDVGIILFDSGLDLLDEESGGFSNVRQSEAVWFSSQLKQVLEYSNAWGVVRTMPSQNAVMDLIVSGKIIESNGEVVKLFVEAHDASGTQWLSKEYFQRASVYAYHPEVKSTKDPFQSLFNEIANDLFDARMAMSTEQLVNIRTISKMRFAADFVPDAFTEFLTTTQDGYYKVQRLPAENDPMMIRVERIQARNDLFLDVVQDYYRVFNQTMSAPYEEWRKLSYKEVLYERQLKAQARKEKITGAMLILAGVLAQGSSSGNTRTGGHVAILSGAQVFRSGYAKQDEAILHTQTLRELGESLEAELEPSIIDLQDRSITLSGTVDEQFNEWRRLLAKMFEVEQGGDIDGVLPSNQQATQDLTEATEELDNQLQDSSQYKSVRDSKEQPKEQLKEQLKEQPKDE